MEYTKYYLDKLNVINSAILEYSSGEQQISTLFNGFVDIANMFHDENKAQTQSDKYNWYQYYTKGLKFFQVIEGTSKSLKSLIKLEIMPESSIIQLLV